MRELHAVDLCNIAGGVEFTNTPPIIKIWPTLIPVQIVCTDPFPSSGDMIGISKDTTNPNGAYNVMTVK